MAVYKYLRALWKQPKTNEMWKERLVEWRKEPTTVRIERPTRLDRARSVGYKPKQGIILVRQRVSKSPRMREGALKGRRPKTARRKKIVKINYRVIAEQRANKKFKNCEVLNSYWVTEDGKSKWYEIILVDRTHPAVLADDKLNWISLQRGRTFRGTTTAGRKSRGLSKKGKGSEKTRPSVRANNRRTK